MFFLKPVVLSVYTGNNIRVLSAENQEQLQWLRQGELSQAQINSERLEVVPQVFGII